MYPYSYQLSYFMFPPATISIYPPLPPAGTFIFHILPLLAAYTPPFYRLGHLIFHILAVSTPRSDQPLYSLYFMFHIHSKLFQGYTPKHT